MLHKAAKAAFDEAGLKKLSRVKELNIECAERLKARKNVEMFFADNRGEQEQQQIRMAQVKNQARGWRNM